MTRNDVIRAMATAIHTADGHCHDNSFEGCDAAWSYGDLADKALSAIEALGLRIIPVEMSDETAKALQPWTNYRDPIYAAIIKTASLATE